MRNNKDASLNMALTPADTAVSTLGQSACASPKCSDAFTTDEAGVLVGISRDTLATKDVAPVFFEEAGPRQQLFFSPHKTKIAIVTCGGICPGINDVIRSIVMEAHHHYGVAATLGIRYGLRGFIPACRHDVMEFFPDNVAEIQQFGGTILGSSRGSQPVDEIVDAMERLGIGFCIFIGGVGTMRAAEAIGAEIAGRDLPIGVVCIPKTVDNDIHFVSRTFGFSTAAEQATEAIACAHVEAVGAPYGIGLVKLMGRQSGFIAAEASMGLKHVNMVLVPEEPFALTGPGGVIDVLETRLRTRGHAVIVAAEGAGQHLVDETGRTDPSGNPVLGDFCGLLSAEIKRHFKEKALPITMKAIDPSYIIRSVPANTADAVYCGFLGRLAVHAGMAGKTGLMIGSVNDRYVHVPLPLVTRERKHIDIHSDYWQAVLDSTGQPRFAPDQA
ncbi:ATP-dependent 6-phosphofructokinase [Desulfovibrio sp. TomC]|uniref:ATP-dependent 6-phosphofructokinase n=1 Tax=Desulfovibrio sp. TomC TaxID=1562888 RepID=UPI000575459B|nr:ATP-dependent 6-phosphofructokinase [Desulfovibrio sp. TomC]KHK03764.1 6-phosphofructokinase [Desulfovibrio sp. TomC]